MPGRRAIFLDRDGVLNRVVWRDGKPASPRHVDELQIVTGVEAALRDLKAMGFLLFAVTNQPDVRRGLMTDAALDELHAALARALPLDEIAACRHDDRDGCACRKPKAGLLLDLAERWNIDLAGSWMVGDMDRDTICGRAAGVSTILLARPYNSAAGADRVVDDLTGAVRAITQDTLQET
ncbi:D-glycero-alpha-D-manno-heptose-1,7-bisphosphate 7-phosphatase [Caulobacter sp. NIBR2454]|uniref:D-glycero-alpha-D-manno-heptose-1,7-bisphosphate 7-phosphatase n=1 Tax=Caulobacter sp. NIBR2454 TaxID=3015996 RepID=UPI0022B61D44|nr:HAD-IIIA family hydrolase [Caulobacter sp. NIBR2454]